jgi:hypothetical protein
LKVETWRWERHLMMSRRGPEMGEEGRDGGGASVPGRRGAGLASGFYRAAVSFNWLMIYETDI